MLVHFERLQAPEVYAVRWFDEPLGLIDPATGQPWKPYVASAVLSVDAHRQGELSLMQSMGTPACLPAFRHHLRDLLPHVQGVHWERWKDQQKRKVPLYRQ